MDQKANDYCKGYIAALYAGEIPPPSNGDCWGCLMVAENGQTPMGGAGHMQSHIDETYYVPALLVRAIERFPVSIVAKLDLAALWGKTPYPIRDTTGIARKQLTNALRRHIKAELANKGLSQ